MKANLLKGVAVALLGVASLCYGQTNVFQTKLARASEGSGTVYCNCDSSHGNQKCSAANTGNSCASGDNIQCSDYNGNCAQ